MTRLRELLRNGVASPYYYSLLHEGGGKGSAPAPIYTAPAAAPQAAEAATQEVAETPEEEAKKIAESQKKGAKSLQIPLTDTAGSDAGMIGTGNV